MPRNKRHISRISKKRSNRRSKADIKNIFFNISIGTLSIFTILFLTSMVKQIFFNSGLDLEHPDLSTLITQTIYEKETGHKIQVEIWNGCGIENLALIYKKFLRQEGVDVLNSKNADHFNYQNTIICHHRGDLERALSVAKILKIDSNKIIEHIDNNLFYDLTVIIGHDYDSLQSYHDAILFQPHF